VHCRFLVLTMNIKTQPRA